MKPIIMESILDWILEIVGRLIPKPNTTVN